MKNQKGITLVALIITIIVMVILAGVIITAAVADGGIIDKAKISMREKEKAEIQDIINASLVIKKFASSNTLAYLDLGKTGIAIYENLTENGFKVDGKPTTDENGNSATTVPYDEVNEELSVKVEGDHGTYEGTVTENGLKEDIEIVEDDKNIPPSDEGENKDDINSGNNSIWVDNGDGTYTNGEVTVEAGITTYTNDEVLEKLGESGGTYTGTWTVIGVEDGKLKLVSSKCVKYGVEVGQFDSGVFVKDENGIITTTVKPEIIEIYNFKEDDGLKLEKAIWSYQHAVETLNGHAKTATGIESARSIKVEDIYDIIGEENVTKSTSYGKMYNYYFNGTTVYSKNKATANDEYPSRKWY